MNELYGQLLNGCYPPHRQEARRASPSRLMSGYFGVIVTAENRLLPLDVFCIFKNDRARRDSLVSVSLVGYQAVRVVFFLSVGLYIRSPQVPFQQTAQRFAETDKKTTGKGLIHRRVRG